MMSQGYRIKIAYHSGDADALWGSRKSVDVAGCSPCPRSVWHKPYDYAMHGGRRGSRRHTMMFFFLHCSITILMQLP